MAEMSVGPILGGREVQRPGGGVFVVRNPATGQPIARERCCSPETVARIVADSKALFESAEWQRVPAADRGRRLLRLADLLEERAGEFIELELQDTGKPISQLRGGEIPLAAAIIRFYAGAADKIEGRLKSTDGGCFHVTLCEPYGVVAGILPWNYPLVNAAMKVAPALAAGNVIVLKPSVETPLSTVRFARLCLEAGFPPGAVNVVLGSGSAAGLALAGHPAVKKVSFTGSTAVGQTIQKLAAETMKAVNLECGGKNAILVFEDADLERAAQAAAVSAFVNCGQLCVSCSRLLVQETIAGSFLECLRDKVARIVVGDPRSPDTLVGPMITEAQYRTVLGYLEQAPGQGCRVVCGGGKLALPPPFAGGFWVQPTILAGVRPGMAVHDEEIFGPVLSVLTFRDEGEAVALSNHVQYGLSGSVWTADGQRALRLGRALDTGIIWVNTMLTGYPQIPVPPHKMSGTGVELGIEGLLAYCKRKSLMLGYDTNAPVGWGL